MASDTGQFAAQIGEPSPTSKPSPSSSPSSAMGPFVLRPLLHDVPLSSDGASDDIKINCVDYLGRNPSTGCASFLATVANMTCLRCRWQPLCRHHRLGAASFLPHTARPTRSERNRHLYTCVSTAPDIFGAVFLAQWPPTWSPADPPAAARRQSLHSLQLDRHILLLARAESRIRHNPGSKLQLDWGRGPERGFSRRRRRKTKRGYDFIISQPSHTGGQDRRGCKGCQGK